MGVVGCGGCGGCGGAQGWWARVVEEGGGAGCWTLCDGCLVTGAQIWVAGKLGSWVAGQGMFAWWLWVWCVSLGRYRLTSDPDRCEQCCDGGVGVGGVVLKMRGCVMPSSSIFE